MTETSTEVAVRSELALQETVPGVTSVTAQPRNGGVQVVVTFENGYGASIVRGPFTYGGPQGFWEIAVLDADGALTYSTPVTDDVIGWLDAGGVRETLQRIGALPKGATDEH